MCSPAILRLTRMMLAALVALALTATAFAHRMPADADRLAFVQATGASLSDLCGDVGTGSFAKPPCEACQISGQMLPPCPVSGLVVAHLAPGNAVLPPDRALLPALSHDPGHPPRAPPAA